MMMMMMMIMIIIIIIIMSVKLNIWVTLDGKMILLRMDATNGLTKLSHCNSMCVHSGVCQLEAVPCELHVLKTYQKWT